MPNSRILSKILSLFKKNKREKSAKSLKQEIKQKIEKPLTKEEKQRIEERLAELEKILSNSKE